MLIPFPYLVKKYKLHVRGVLHVGAHLGEEAQAYVDMGVLNVTWVEANPEIFARLVQHVQPFGHYVFSACVSDKVEQVQFRVTNNGESSSILQFGTHAETSPQAVVTHELTLQTRRLDDLPICHPYNFLNLDLQGFELPALRGMGSLIDQVDYVYTEVNNREVYLGGTLIHELDEYLSGFKRVETQWCMDAGIDHGWGDAFYVRQR